MTDVGLPRGDSVDGGSSDRFGDRAATGRAPDARRRFAWRRSTPYRPAAAGDATGPGDGTARGAEIVARRLVKLSGDWALVHGLTVGPLGATLDHLVIGPPGVFALTTTPAGGTLTVYAGAILHDGRDTGALSWAREAAERTRVALGDVVPSRFTVTPVVVVPGRRPDVRSHPDGLVVVRDRRLRRLLRRRPGLVLSAPQVRTLADAACRPETWGLPSEVEASTDSEPRGIPAPEACTVVRSDASGRDRLVVWDTAGRRLGWLDLDDQRLTVEAAGSELAVRMALSAWRAANMLP